MEVSRLFYRHQKSAPYFFQNLTFSLEKGKLHALHGKNGTGKSVLLNLLSGRKPHHAMMTGEIKRGEGVIFVNQRYDEMIADQFSFKENLQFACMSYFPSFFSKLREPIFYVDFLERFHINCCQPVYKLSGGQRQILALLMALQQRGDLLLLDEPTATLDEENANMVFEFLKIIQDKMTLLVVCHDRELLADYVDGENLFLEVGQDGCRRIRTG